MNVAGTRAALIERDGDECSYCGKPSAGTPEGRLTVDHKTPIARGGAEEMDNYQLLCGACNNEKGTRTDEEAQRLVRFTSSVATAGYTVAHNIVLFDTRLSTSARLLYFQLRHYGYMCQYAYVGSPEQNTLASNLGIKERALRPYLTELVDASLIRVKRRGRGRSNVYIICEPTCGKDQDRQYSAGHNGQDRQYSAGPLKEKNLKTKKDFAPSRFNSQQPPTENIGTRENLRQPNDQNSIFRVVKMISNGSITDDLMLEAELRALKINGFAADSLREQLATHLTISSS